MLSGMLNVDVCVQYWKIEKNLEVQNGCAAGQKYGYQSHLFRYVGLKFFWREFFAYLLFLLFFVLFLFRGFRQKRRFWSQSQLVSVKQAGPDTKMLSVRKWLTPNKFLWTSILT